MRPRAALALAGLALLPAAGPLLAEPGAPLAAHALGARTQFQALVDLAARAPRDFGAPLPVLPDGATAKLLHVSAGGAAWEAWLVSGNATLLDVDGDGLPELRVALDPRADLRLHLDGLRPASRPWALWLDDGAGQWGLSGQGQPPREASLELRDGAVRVAARGATSDWHAAFLGAPGRVQGVAWLLEGTAPVLLAEAGRGAALHALTAGSTVRALLLDGERHSGVTLAGAPAGAVVERGEDGSLRYHAPRGGGALRYEGDAGPIGQAGDLALSAPQLPGDLRVEPRGPGFVLAAAQPTDLGLDWQPPGEDVLRVRARGTDGLAGSPGPAGLVLRGTGEVQVQQGAERAAASLTDSQGVLLRSDGSPLLLAGLIALLGGGVWARRAWAAPRGASPQRHVE